MCSSKPVTEQGLQNLRSYVYKGVDNSLAGKLFLNQFWNWAVNFLPLWLAPNIVTLFGGICIFISAFICYVYTPTFTEAPPGWALVLNAFLIWLYQTADNLDGKQARRTRAGSPLGELFDHGIDAIVMGLVSVIVCSAVRLGPKLSLLALLIAITPFYLSHWLEYHEGMLVMGEFTGPTELQIGVIGLLFFTALMPVDFWLKPVFNGKLLLNQTFLIIALISVIIGAFVYTKDVWKLTRPGGASVSGNTTTQALRQPFLYFCFISFCLLWIYSTFETVLIHPHLYALAITLAFAYMTQRLIVQRICREPFYVPISPHIVIGFGVLIGILNLADVVIFTNFVALLVVVLCALVLELYFAVSIINQLSSFLGIRPFVIPYSSTTVQAPPLSSEVPSIPPQSSSSSIV